MEDPQYMGIIAERTQPTDWLGAEIDIPSAPKGTQSFKKNGSIQYDQRLVNGFSCTLHASLGAYSDLTGYKFTLEERKAMWDEAVALGANPNLGWYVDAAVDLVRRYANKNLPVKVSTYRVSLDADDFWLALAMGYSVVTGFRGNAQYNEDKADLILDGLKFFKSTYGHCVRIAYSVGDSADQIIDNYLGSKTNIYKVPSDNWEKLVDNGVFFRFGYIFLLK